MTIDQVMDKLKDFDCTVKQIDGAIFVDCSLPLKLRSLNDLDYLVYLLSEDSSKNAIGRCLTAARENAGLSVKDLGNLVGIAPSYISAIENKRVSPTIETIRKIQEKLSGFSIVK